MAAGLAILPALLSAVGTGVGVIGSLQQASAAKEAEKQRRQQVRLEALRRRRESIRQASVARAQATASATNQGAAETSSLAGGLAQIQSQNARNVHATQQDKAISENIFKANMDYADAGGLIAIGNGISSLGGSFGSVMPEMQKMGWTGA